MKKCTCIGVIGCGNISDAYFNALPFEYRDADKAVRALRRSGTRSAVDIARTKREWRDTMRASYRKAAELARKKGTGR